MNTRFSYLIVAIAVAVLSAVALKADQEKLTPERVASLTATDQTQQGKTVLIEISGIGRFSIPPNSTNDYRGMIMGSNKPFIYPINYDIPRMGQFTNSPGSPAVCPSTPLAFDTIYPGWTLHFNARREGSVIVIDGVADFIKVKLVNGGYGALAGPIYGKNGETLTVNTLEQPLEQNTATHFFLTAIPGENYDVLLYKGETAETHSVNVTLH